MPGKGSRRSVKKSRNGCARCKSQHLKCDEQQPSCGRCERLGVRCPGYGKTLKWSTKHEINKPRAALVMNEQAIISPAAEGSVNWLDFNLPTSTLVVQDEDVHGHQTEDLLPGLPLLNTPSWSYLDDGFFESELLVEDSRPSAPQRRPMLQSLGVYRPIDQWRIQSPLVHQESELISYYFRVVPRVYSTFDNARNPFRSAVSSLFNHSLAVNLAAQSMAAAWLAEVHPRFATLGTKLRQDALEAVKMEKEHSYPVLLALMMSGPTGNWHRADDLGIIAYHDMKCRLDALASAGTMDDTFHFFREAMVLWEMFLTFMADSSILGPSLNHSPAIRCNPAKHQVHPWTGVARETMQLVSDIGRLVRQNRSRSFNQKFVTQTLIQQMGQDLDAARDLEARLLACQHPSDNDVISTEDAATPVWHITTIAEVHRYAGLLQLYRVFPDMLANRLQTEISLGNSDAVHSTEVLNPTSPQARNKWLTDFAMEALRLLEAIPIDSGTKDFQPFLLVALSSELICESEDAVTVSSEPISSGTPAPSESFVEVALMRKFVVDRLTSFMHVIPPKPLRVCLNIVQEVWRRIDNGQQNVYWLDIVIEKGWETIMA